MKTVSWQLTTPTNVHVNNDYEIVWKLDTWHFCTVVCWHNSISDTTNIYTLPVFWINHWVCVCYMQFFQDDSVFTCDQAALRTFLSVRLPVRPSVRLLHLVTQCFCHRVIMTLSGVITNDRSDVHTEGQGQRSKVKVTEVKTPFSNFRTVTPVWIRIWWWNDGQSLMLLRRGALLFFKVIRQISRSHG